MQEKMQSKVSIMKRLIKVLNFSKNDQERKWKTQIAN